MTNYSTENITCHNQNVIYFFFVMSAGYSMAVKVLCHFIKESICTEGLNLDARML